jgi:hypothetical protein
MNTKVLPDTMNPLPKQQSIIVYFCPWNTHVTDCLYYRNKLLERRVSSLMDIGAETTKARDLETYWNLVLDTLAVNDKDIPLAILYSVEQQGAVPKISKSLETSRECFLKGTLGLPFNHPVAPARLDLTHGSDGFIPYLRNPAKSREPTLLHIDDTPFSQCFAHEIQWMW